MAPIKLRQNTKQPHPSNNSNSDDSSSTFRRFSTPGRGRARQVKTSCRHQQQHQLQHQQYPLSPSNGGRSTKTSKPSCLTSVTLTALLLLCWGGLPGLLMADCPNLCECKWKSGKESVMCLNANLTHIPTRLDAGTQVLDLTGNEVATIPHDTFAAANLLNLQKVFLAKCRLRIIERYAFRKLNNLVELDLSYNQLTAIPTQSFESIPELREIKLTGNPIYRVQDEAFIRVPQLVRLEMSDCKLAIVERRAFAGLESSLEWLKLDGNKLSEVRSGTLTSLANLHGLELARNQWNCSCSLRPLRAWMMRENIPYGIPPLCRAPSRLAGKTWDKIDLDDFACVPQIIATDTTAHGVEGRNVTMSCYVEGVPEPSVRWMVKNRVIANLTAAGDSSSSPRTAAATQGRKTYVVNMLRNASNLTILTADMQDAGIYTCAAENKAGKVEASVTLAVSRRPPEAPLGVKIILVCILIALLFVVGSSFAAICFCSLRRKRKRHLWNTVPAERTESYEKIEMSVGRGVGGGSSGGVGSSVIGGGAGGKSDESGGACYRNEENGYLKTTTTPLTTGGGGGAAVENGGIAIVNHQASSASAKRNGDYRNVPTHCDDDGAGYEDNENNGTSGCGKSSNMTTTAARKDNNNSSLSGLSSSSTSRWKGATLRTSPQDIKRKLGGNGSASSSCMLEETDLHIPRLIDIGSNPDSASSSISSQVDAAARLTAGGYAHVKTWTTQIATTKITSPHSNLELNAGGQRASSAYGSDDITSSVFCASRTPDRELFDSNYPDLLDIAKYAAAAAAAAANNSASSSMHHPATSQVSSGVLCTLPRKLKNSAKYFKNSSDSQSALLADSSSKYGSSTLGDASFLNDFSMERRFSAESYSNYTPSSQVRMTNQRSNSFLNLVQSSNKGGAGVGLMGSAVHRRNPSLPSSPVREVHQHQRSFSSAATPLLDFTSLTSRVGAGVPGIASSLSHHQPAPPSTSTVTAYDYHAAQLERFLEEYRNLQDQLCKMKETCDSIRKKEAPLRGALGHSAQFADPVMFNAAMANSPISAEGHPPNPKNTMLKNKAILPGQPPDPPPYWLHRNAMLKRLNDSQTDIFKS